MQEKQESGSQKNELKNRDSRSEDALAALDKIYNHMKDDIGKGDRNFNEAIIKFERKYSNLNIGQNATALSCYGKTFCNPTKRGKIKVQPAAVSRRLKKNGSRQKQDSSRCKKMELPERRITKKREHSISKVIEANQPAAKKAGRSMLSISTSKKRVKSKTDKIKKHKYL